VAGVLVAACSGGGGGSEGSPSPASPPGESAPTTSVAPATTLPATTAATLPVPSSTTSAPATTLPPAPDTGLWAVGPGGQGSWVLPLESGIRAATPLAEGDGVVVAAGADCAGGLAVVGLDAASGAGRWQLPLAGTPAADEHSAAGGVVVVRLGGAATTLVGIDLATGAERWRADLGTVPVTAADLRADPVVVAQQPSIGETTQVRAFGRGDGGRRWDAPLVGERGVLGAVAATEGVALFALDPAAPPSVVGVDPASGTVRWERPGTGLPAAASAAGGVVAATADTGLVGLDLATGSIRWQRDDLVDPFVPPGLPLSSAGVVLAGEEATGRISGIRLADGATAFVAADGEAPAGAGPGGLALVGAGAPDALMARIVTPDGAPIGQAGPLPTAGGRDPVPVLVGAAGTAYLGRSCPS